MNKEPLNLFWVSFLVIITIMDKVYEFYSI